MQEYITVLPHSFIRCSHVRGPEGLAQSLRIAVYLLPCVLIWDADLALIVAAHMAVSQRECWRDQL